MTNNGSKKQVPSVPTGRKQKQYKRRETYESLMEDLASSFDSKSLIVIDSYIHSPLLVDLHIDEKLSGSRRDFGTIKQLLQEVYNQQERGQF